MCAISGIFKSNMDTVERSDSVAKMTSAMSHRGPDHEAVWSEESVPLTMGHARLSIRDLSPMGHQPMISKSGRSILTFNGEIYNQRELGNVLIECGHAPQGDSDSEVLLEYIDLFGLEKTLNDIRGMFAFALWDRKNRSLTLVRDRVGEKPLYYAVHRDGLYFASELKGLKKILGKWLEVDRDSIAEFMRFGYIISPHSIYQGVKKLCPGHYIQFKSEESLEMSTPLPYWELPKPASMRNQRDVDAFQAQEQLETLLRSVIEEQMIADVKLGAFLSGGIDSSLVVALMQSLTTCPVNTFSIGFHQKEYNEANYASEIAKHLGTKHQELYVNDSDVLSTVSKIPTMYDEPFSDSSQIPTYLLSEMTKNSVTVALSGDGGDELFAGYNRYFEVAKTYQRLSQTPKILRTCLSHAFKSDFVRQPASIIASNIIKAITGRNAPIDRINQKLLGISDRISNISLWDLYQIALSHWQNPTELVFGSHERPSRGPSIMSNLTLDRDLTIEGMRIFDAKVYLPDDILTKVDRASMANSLEVRIPLLDKKIIEFAFSQPNSLHVTGNSGKTLLKNILKKYIPDKLIDRPKMGFGVPLEYLLRGPLHDQASSFFNIDRINREGFLNHAVLNEKWLDFKSGNNTWKYLIWNAFVFQMWTNEQA